jgi:CheY-like chemotaxis protein
MAVGIRVMVVDDDETIRRLLQVNLEMEDYVVVLAEDGVDALAKLRASPVDLVLLDIMMPKMDGWTVCEEMKADGALRDIPVVFLSARAQDADIARGVALGAAYVTKPFDPFDLLELVADLTGTA